MLFDVWKIDIDRIKFKYPRFLVLTMRVFRHFWPWGRIKRLRNALDKSLDFGIYPRSWEGKWEERNDYQNGWNDCAMGAIERLQGTLKHGDWMAEDNE